MAEFTYVSHTDINGGQLYQLMVRSTKGIFGEQKQPLCYSNSDLLSIIRATIPFLRQAAAQDEIGVVLIGIFPYIAYKAIHDHVDMICEGRGFGIHYHESMADIVS